MFLNFYFFGYIISILKILNVLIFKGYCNERILYYYVLKWCVKDMENCIMFIKCLGFFFNWLDYYDIVVLVDKR